MGRHARPSSGRGGGWFVALAFTVLAVGAYLANAANPTSQRPAIGLAALVGAALALFSARAERQTSRRIEKLSEVRRRDAARMRLELDEAHARTHRALLRAIAAESAAQSLIAATETLLALHWAGAMASPPATAALTIPFAPPVVAMPPPATPPLPMPAPAAPVVEPAAAVVPAPPPEAAPAEHATPLAPAAALARPLEPPTLVWPLAELPAQLREPSLDLPLVTAPARRVAPLFVPVESPAARAVSPSTATTSGTEPSAAPQLVDLTSTSTTRYARPA